MKRTNNTGFTIVELLIASSVFSVILLICTTAIIQISRNYNKGLIQSQTQETARSIMEDVSRTIQFDGSTPIILPPSGNKNILCVGEKRYSYILDGQLETAPDTSKSQRYNVIVIDKLGAPSNCPNASVVNDMAAGNPLAAPLKELLSPHMRLAKLQVSLVGGTSDLYQINLRVVYGDDDLLNATHDNCTGAAGNQFCAVSGLSTVVKKRVQ